MAILRKTFQSNVKLDIDNRDDPNSSIFDSIYQDNVQSSFDWLDQIGAPSDTLGGGPWFYRVDTGSEPLAGWVAGIGPAPRRASQDSSAPSVSAASGSSPGGAVAMAGPAPMAPASGPEQVSTPGSGLVFDNTYLGGCTAQFIACIVAAEEHLESLFTNSDMITVSFNEENQGAIPDVLDNSSNSFYPTSYSQLRTALQAAAPGDVLPTTDPSGGSGIWSIPEAYARMLGLTTARGSPELPYDLAVTLNTYYGPYDFGQDVINGLTHELSEGGLGRVGGLGDSGGVWSTMDLFRYSAPGVPDYTDGRDGDTTCFSSNGSTLSDQDLPTARLTMAATSPTGPNRRCSVGRGPTKRWP